MCVFFKDIIIIYNNIYLQFIFYFHSCEYQTVSYFILKHMTAVVFILMSSLWTSEHQLAFNRHKLTAIFFFFHAPNCVKSLKHPKVVTAPAQPDHRLIHKIKKSLADILHRTADPYANIPFSLCVCVCMCVWGLTQAVTGSACVYIYFFSEC